MYDSLRREHKHVLVACTAETLDLGSVYIRVCVCVFGKFWTIGEGCQYTDKAGIFESLMSHRQWATASQAEMGRPELVSA